MSADASLPERYDAGPSSTVQGPQSAVAGRDVSLLDLRLERDPAGVTRPARCLAHAPLQLSRVRYDDPAQPETAVLTLLHLGGVLAGDRAALRVALGAGASTRVRMAAATQVLSMPRGDAAHTLDIDLAPGSRLEWLAEPLILFAGASFAQTTRVVLGAGARLTLLDVLAPGRLARGERFAFTRYQSRLEVLDPVGRLLLAERTLLEPASQALVAPGILGETPVVGSLWVLGHDVDAEPQAAMLCEQADAHLAATPLPNGCGLLVRALGVTPTAVRQTLLACYTHAQAVTRPHPYEIAS
jgi:urease accessory protein